MLREPSLDVLGKTLDIVLNLSVSLAFGIACQSVEIFKIELPHVSYHCLVYHIYPKLLVV
jgi:hypothetical protein